MDKEDMNEVIVRDGIRQWEKTSLILSDESCPDETHMHCP